MDIAYLNATVSNKAGYFTLSKILRMQIPQVAYTMVTLAAVVTVPVVVVVVASATVAPHCGHIRIYV